MRTFELPFLLRLRVSPEAVLNVNLLTVNCHYFRTRMIRIERIKGVLLQIIMIAPYIVDSGHLLEEDIMIVSYMYPQLFFALVHFQILVNLP